MNWSRLFELAIEVFREFLDNCPEQSRLDFGRAALRTPSDRQQRRFENVLKRRATAPFTGICTRREWNRNEDEIKTRVMSWGKDLTDWEVDELCEA